MADTKQPLRILIADDDAVFVSLTRACLEGAGHVVDAAGDGAAALEALHVSAYDAVIIDLGMPKIDGFRLIALIRSSPLILDIPILVLSSRSDVAAVEEAYRLGANAFETKPINWTLFPSHIWHVVRSTVTTSALKAALYDAQRKHA